MVATEVYEGFFRSDENEHSWYLEKPTYRTKLVRDFPDAFVTNLVNDDRSEYDLAWVGRTNIRELRGLLNDVGGDFRYNDFDLNKLLNSLAVYAPDVGFYFGREGSPVLYIDLPTDLGDMIGRITRADESDPDRSGLHRLWWD